MKWDGFETNRLFPGALSHLRAGARECWIRAYGVGCEGENIGGRSAVACMAKGHFAGLMDASYGHIGFKVIIARRGAYRPYWREDTPKALLRIDCLVA